MTQTDQSALAYLARRDVSVQWRDFFRAVLETLDTTLEREGRDTMLRKVGERFAAAMPLPAAEPPPPPLPVEAEMELDDSATETGTNS